ncbi:MAG: hypothetical protein CMO10_03560 [Thalassospira sp.]|nr:hypothetical protein [Thalassospira sp.]
MVGWEASKTITELLELEAEPLNFRVERMQADRKNILTHSTTIELADGAVCIVAITVTISGKTHRINLTINANLINLIEAKGAFAVKTQKAKRPLSRL